MKYKIIPCRNMNDVPDVVLARIVSFLDPISQCNVAPVSSVLRQVVAGQADSKGGPITPEQRRLAARSYFKTVILEDLIASIRHGERNPGVLYEEAFSILPHSVHDHFESIFLRNLEEYTLNEPPLDSVYYEWPEWPKCWAIEALRDIVTHILTLPGQERYALNIIVQALPDLSKGETCFNCRDDARYNRRLLIVPIVRALVSRAEASGVSDPFADMLDEEIKNELLSIYSTCVASLPGRESEGLEMASAIRDAYQSSVALAYIARHMVMIPGQEERAVELAITISNEVERALALQHIVDHIVRIPGQESRAVEIVNTHLKVDARARSLLDLSRYILTVPGQKLFALEVAYMLDRGWNDDVLEEIAWTFVDDDLEFAIRIASDIYSPRDHRSFFFSLYHRGYITESDLNYYS